MRRRRTYGGCRDCDARILFVQLDTGNIMPVDPGGMSGNVAFRNRAGTWIGYVISADKPLTPGHKTGTPHFASCPARQKPHRTKPTEPPPTLF